MRYSWIFLLSFVLLTGCRDPYDQANIPQDSSKKYGSYQDIIRKDLTPAAARKTSEKKAKIWKVEIGDAPMTGDKNAPVTIVEFSDFQCPFCARGTKTLHDILKKYKGKVRLVFKHFPLGFHKYAQLAAEAAVEAQRQGKFWEYHDLLFANSKKLARKDLEKYAASLKLNMKQFREALDKGLHKARIEGDKQQGEAVGVRGTPTAYVNGRETSVTPQKLTALIEEELKATAPLLAKGLKGDALYKEIIKNGKLNSPKKPPSLPQAGPKAPQDKPQPRHIFIGDAPTLGSNDAPVTIVEFSDFQCPYCGRASRTIRRVKKAYGDKVRLVFKHFPLNFHPFAKLAAQASMAAHEQGKFWEYHDILFSHQKNLARPFLIQYAKKLELDIPMFVAKMDAYSTVSYIEDDMKQGQKLGVQGTPAFFINGQLLSGAQPYSRFKEMIDAELLKKGYKKEDLPEEPPIEIEIGSAPWKGNPKAPVTIVEFSDFQCPFCARGAKSLMEFYKYYKKAVKIVFKQFPLSFHKQANLAAQASLAAHAQGKFWEYHDLLFANRTKLKRPDLERYAQQLHLNMQLFKSALDSQQYKSQIDEDINQGIKLGVAGTPTLFINGVKAKGYSFDDLKKQVDPILLKHGYKKENLPRRPPKKVIIGNAPSKGNPKSPVTLVEFSDFQCPYCSRASKVITNLAKAYGDKIRIVFKQFPLSFHKNALLAAQAALAAHEQGKFWQYHDKLFANQQQLQRPYLEQYARELGLDMKRFKAALDSGKFKKWIDKDIENGNYLGVRGTPSFFINDKPVNAYTFKAFKKLIDPILLKHGYKKADLPEFPVKKIPIPVAAPTKGPENAPITIVEFSDFQCPFCGRAASFSSKIVKLYPKLVKVIFINFPLSFHKNAFSAAEAAMAAHEQGKFWQYHDKLFANQRNLNRTHYLKFARELGLNMKIFTESLNIHKFKSQVQADMKIAQEVGVRGTPSFFVNNRPVETPTFAALKKAVEKAIQKLHLKKPLAPPKKPSTSQPTSQKVHP